MHEEMGKTYVFDNNSGSDATTTALLAGLMNKQGVDPNMLAMMGNGGMGGQNGMFMMLFLLLLLGRDGFGGLGGNGGALNTVTNNELLMNAINGNNGAIRDLATNTNTSITAVNGALSALNTQLATIAGQNNLNSAQVINAIQAGNASLASQLASCCCDTRTAINEQGFQNRFAELQQTNQLTATMNANHSDIMRRLTEQEFAALRDKLDASRERETRLIQEISQRTQNEFIYSQTQPIYNRLSELERRELPTYSQPYYPGVPVGPGAIAFGAPYGGFPCGGGCGCHHGHHHGQGSDTTTA